MKQVLRNVVLLLLFITSTLTLTAEEQGDKRRDILRYGLENEIVEMVKELEQKKDTSFNSDLEQLFERTRSIPVRESILSLYTSLENPAFSAYCLEVLADPWNYRPSTVRAVFGYIQTIKPPEASALVRSILDNESEEFRDQAIRTLGKIGNDDDAAYLFDYLQGSIHGDERQRLIIRQTVMTALGELRSEAVWEDFVSIARDDEENTMIRSTAVRAIGLIGKEGGSKILADIYETDDPLLRGAVINGISGYTDQLAVDVVLEGLKDTHYRVRLEALDSVKKLMPPDAAPFVQYRAQHDPVEAVKMRAFDVLAALGDTASTTWMIEQVREEKTPDKIRMRIITVLVEHNPEHIIEDAVQIAFASLKDDRKTWIRYELGKLFAKHHDSRISDVALAYVQHRDTVTKSLGIEIFNRHRFENMTADVEAIASDEKMGGLHRQAKRSLAEEVKTESPSSE